MCHIRNILEAALADVPELGEAHRAHNVYLLEQAEAKLAKMRAWLEATTLRTFQDRDALNAILDGDR